MEVDNAAEMCKQELVNVKPFQLRAEPEKEMLMLTFKRSCSRSSEMKSDKKCSALALRHTISPLIYRFVKIGCALLLDAVGAFT